MKVPFSYRDHFLYTTLCVSLVGHLIAFGSWSFLVPTPQYAVEHSFSNLEATLTNEPRRQVKPQKDEAIAMDKSFVKSQAVQKREPPKSESHEAASLPSGRGALEETKPNYLKNPAPPYPRIARESGWEGVVVLKILVERDGRPAKIDIEKSSGYKVLDESARKTVRKWHFRPAHIGNAPFSSWIRVPVRFRLTDPE